MGMFDRSLGIVAWMGLGIVPVAAHHAFAAEFDAHSTITLTGTVTKVAWLNPHARFFMQVKDSRGHVAEWELVIGSPNVLMRQGWDRTFVKGGDVITVMGFQARDGSHTAAARSVRLPDGHMAYFGSAGDGGPERVSDRIDPGH